MRSHNQIQQILATTSRVHAL